MTGGAIDERKMIGQQVTVTYDTNLIVEGHLLAISARGEFVIKADDGDVWYCWPRLKMVLRHNRPQ